MKILFFGPLEEISGSREIIINSEIVQNTNSLRRYLSTNFPGIGNYHYSISVNKIIINDNCPLQPDDEIGILPPYAGG